MYRYLLRNKSTLNLFAALFLLLLNGVPTYAGQNAVEIESAKVWVGKKAKGFILPGMDGKSVDIARKLGKRPVVLVFYRGVW